MSAGVVLAIILIFVLLALAILFLVLWLVHRNKTIDNAKELAITGVKITVKEPLTLLATWESVGSVNDLVTLYADTIPINIESNGKPDPSKNPNILQTGSVDGGQKTLSLGGLKDNQTYYAKLVVTNTKFSGYNAVDGKVHTGKVPNSAFIVSDINEPGAITLTTPTTDVDKTTVKYVTTPNKSNINDLWEYDPQNLTLIQPGTGVNSGKTWALSTDIESLESVVVAKDLSTITDIKTAQWLYLFSENSICLKDSPDICMNLKTPVSNNSSIELVKESKTKWKFTSVSV